MPYHAIPSLINITRRGLRFPGLLHTKKTDGKTPVSTSIRSEYDKPERKQGSRLFLVESTFSAVMSSMYGNFSGAMAIKAGATTMQMGVLNASIQLLTTISQFSSASVVGVFGGRKTMIVRITLLSALPFAFLAFVPFMPHQLQVWTLIPLCACASALLSIIDPPWGSWMSDMVAQHRRGTFLGILGSISTVVSTIVGMVGAAILDRLEGPAVPWGFMTVFVIAMAARFGSTAMFMKVIDPRPDIHLKPAEMPWKQIADIRKTVLGRFNLLILVFNFAAALMGPVWGVYLLRDLEVSYLTYVGLGVACNIAVVLVMPLWGKLADKKGNMFVLAISAPPVALWPVLFLFSAETWWLVAGHIILGITTPGWGVAAYNFILENSEEEVRPAAVGSYQAMANLGAFTGSLIGGAVTPILPRLFSYQSMTVMLVSVVLQVITMGILLPRVLPGRKVAASTSPVIDEHSGIKTPSD